MLQKQLKKIAEKTTKQANKKRSEGPDLREGDPVYIIRKNIKTQRPSDKLDHTKIGPYRIKRKLGPVTFELELPEGLNIYPVFHKSLLEKAPPNAKPGPVLVHEETQQPIYDVERVVDSKTRKRQRYYPGTCEEIPPTESSREDQSTSEGSGHTLGSARATSSSSG